MLKQKLVHIKTFGCQMNAHDSEKMLGMLKSSGYLPTEEPKRADLILLNTCSIREKAEQKFYSYLGRMELIKKKRPEMKIAVAGCIAGLEKEKLLKQKPAVDIVVGPQNIGELKSLLPYDHQVISVRDNRDIAETEFPAHRKDGVKALVNIMYGCNNYCSYCVVPYTRGREKSRRPESILSEIRDLAENGYREITLLGQNVNSYSCNAAFHDLLYSVSQIEGIARIRFITSHPKDLTDELIKAIAVIDKVCNHLHLPLQSGSDKILKLMNRRYTYDQYMGKIIRLREAIPNIAITSDIIAGFPMETEDDHLQTVRALEEIRFDGIFAFKFSKRAGTKASEMDGHIDDRTKSKRLQEILDLQDNITEEKNSNMVGKSLQVLVEEKGETDIKDLSHHYLGRTDGNKIINFHSTQLFIIGDLVDVLIRKSYKHSLEGELI